jgi:hypothetical protein
MGGEGEEEEFNAEGAKITQRCGEEERGRGKEVRWIWGNKKTDDYSSVWVITRFASSYGVELMNSTAS